MRTNFVAMTRSAIVAVAMLLFIAPAILRAGCTEFPTLSGAYNGPDIQGDGLLHIAYGFPQTVAGERDLTVSFDDQTNPILHASAGLLDSGTARNWERSSHPIVLRHPVAQRHRKYVDSGDDMPAVCPVILKIARSHPHYDVSLPDVRTAGDLRKRRSRQLRSKELRQRDDTWRHFHG